jgi:hypothetical protein
MILGAENGQNLVDRSETLSAVRSLIEQALLYHDFGKNEVYAIKICGIRSALDNSLFDAMLLGTADESQTAPTSRKGAWTCSFCAFRNSRKFRTCDLCHAKKSFDCDRASVVVSKPKLISVDCTQQDDSSSCCLLVNNSTALADSDQTVEQKNSAIVEEIIALLADKMKENLLGHLLERIVVTCFSESAYRAASSGSAAVAHAALPAAEASVTTVVVQSMSPVDHQQRQKICVDGLSSLPAAPEKLAETPIPSKDSSSSSSSTGTTTATGGGLCYNLDGSVAHPSTQQQLQPLDSATGIASEDAISSIGLSASLVLPRDDRASDVADDREHSPTDEQHPTASRPSSNQPFDSYNNASVKSLADEHEEDSSESDSSSTTTASSVVQAPWQCPRCTFENSHKTRSCDVCMFRRAAIAVSMKRKRKIRRSRATAPEEGTTVASSSSAAGSRSNRKMTRHVLEEAEQQQQLQEQESRPSRRPRTSIASQAVAEALQQAVSTARRTITAPPGGDSVGTWVCATCTFENHYDQRRCGVCGGVRTNVYKGFGVIANTTGETSTSNLQHQNAGVNEADASLAVDPELTAKFIALREARAAKQRERYAQKRLAFLEEKREKEIQAQRDLHKRLIKEFHNPQITERQQLRLLQEMFENENSKSANSNSRDADQSKHRSLLYQHRSSGNGNRVSGGSVRTNGYRQRHENSSRRSVDAATGRRSSASRDDVKNGSSSISRNSAQVKAEARSRRNGNIKGSPRRRRRSSSTAADNTADREGSYEEKAQPRRRQQQQQRRVVVQPTPIATPRRRPALPSFDEIGLPDTRQPRQLLRMVEKYSNPRKFPLVGEAYQLSHGCLPCCDTWSKEKVSNIISPIHVMYEPFWIQNDSLAVSCEEYMKQHPDEGQFLQSMLDAPAMMYIPPPPIDEKDIFNSSVSAAQCSAAATNDDDNDDNEKYNQQACGGGSEENDAPGGEIVRGQRSELAAVVPSSSSNAELLLTERQELNSISEYTSYANSRANMEDGILVVPSMKGSLSADSKLEGENLSGLLPVDHAPNYGYDNDDSSDSDRDSNSDVDRSDDDSSTEVLEINSGSDSRSNSPSSSLGLENVAGSVVFAVDAADIQFNEKEVVAGKGAGGGDNEQVEEDDDNEEVEEGNEATFQDDDDGGVSARRVPLYCRRGGRSSVDNMEEEEYYSSDSLSGDDNNDHFTNSAGNDVEGRALLNGREDCVNLVVTGRSLSCFPAGRSETPAILTALDAYLRPHINAEATALRTLMQCGYDMRSAMQQMQLDRPLRSASAEAATNARDATLPCSSSSRRSSSTTSINDRSGNCGGAAYATKNSLVEGHHISEFNDEAGLRLKTTDKVNYFDFEVPVLTDHQRAQFNAALEHHMDDWGSVKVYILYTYSIYW